jgi:hypothetical protein
VGPETADVVPPAGEAPEEPPAERQAESTSGGLATAGRDDGVGADDATAPTPQQQRPAASGATNEPRTDVDIASLTSLFDL